MHLIEVPVDPCFWPKTQHRFWSHVHEDSYSECWLWDGAIRKGYGSFKNSNGELDLPRKDLYAHRVAFFLTYKHWPIPVVRHSCDTPLCCNPDHLLEGTIKQNNQDRARRGRGNNPPGCLSPRSSLTPVQVEEIRSLYPGTPQKQIAQMFDISQTAVSRIITRTRYK